MPTATAEPIILQNEAVWLEFRRAHIGASEVATILGLNKFQSAYHLWAVKTGKLQPDDENRAMRLGKNLEGLLSECHKAKYPKLEVHDPGDFTVFPHPAFPWLTCTPDRIVSDDSTEFPYEMKTLSEYRAKEMADEPLIEHQVQLQVQMAILDSDTGRIGAAIRNEAMLDALSRYHKGDADWAQDIDDFYRVFDYERNDRLINAMIPKLQEFHGRVMSDDPPPVDNTESTAITLAALHPDDNGETVAFGDDVIAAANRLEQVKAEQKALDTERTGCENIIKDALRDATFGEGNGVRYSWKTQERKGAIRVDLTDENVKRLNDAQVAHKVTDGSKFRVLRALKAE